MLNDNFQVVGDYLRDTYWRSVGITTRDPRDLNTVSARLALDMMPGLEIATVFQNSETLVHRFLSWAEKSCEPLQSYATGLLAATMNLQDLAVNFREQNAHLAPIMLKRIWEIQKRCIEENIKEGLNSKRFPAFSLKQRQISESFKSSAKNFTISNKIRDEDADLMPSPVVDDDFNNSEKVGHTTKKKCDGKSKSVAKSRTKGNSSFNGSALNDSSNSSWAEMESYVIGIVY